MQTVDLRSSVLNRTMIVSKRSRRPGLPEIPSSNNENSLPNISPADVKLPNSARVLQRNHVRRETVTVESHGTEPFQLPHSTTMTTSFAQQIPLSATPLQTNITIANDFKKALEDVDKNCSISNEQKYLDLRTRIQYLAEKKEKELNSFIEKKEKDRQQKLQICELKLSVATRTSEKAEAFFKICENCGIDFERILRKESNAIHRMKADALGGDVGRCPESPENDVEIARLTREKESLGDEVRSLEANYSNLFKLYEKMRENCVQLREVEEDLKSELSEQIKKYNSLYKLYNDLLNDAQQKLTNAEIEMKKIVKENADKTLGIRMALKKSKIQIESLEVTLQSKKNENEELNKICNELLSKQDSIMMTSSIMESDESAR